MAKYDDWLGEDKLLLLEDWARRGLTDEQISENIGINKSTLYDWKKKYPDFSNALKKGKEVVDIQVENALLKSAIGYDFDEVTYEEGCETKRVTKHIAPNSTSAIFWLKNRRPDLWRDKKDVELSGEIGIADVLKEARERAKNASQ